MEFYKYHSLGNDYILLDAMRAPLRLSPADIRSLCDRHFGIGGDGILVIEPSERAFCRMLNYNPDASQAETSGNGLRCLAKHLYETGLYPHREMEVDTPSGVKGLSVRVAGGKVRTVEVNMGRPDFRRSSIPMHGEGEEALEVELEAAGRRMTATCLSLGTPHCVIFLEDIESVAVGEIGPAIEKDPAFPLRVNVEFVQVVDLSELRQRSWERGAGETLASAAGAGAAVAAAERAGKCKRRVHVKLPGGLMEVEISASGEVLTRGPARRVFRGRLDEDWRERSRIVLA